MPSRNAIKENLADGIYHAYNRGVERRIVFQDSHDYRRFKSQMATSLAQEPTVTLLAYSLMPNHFHMLLKQADSFGMSRFMKRLVNGYVMYFNRRHHRIGPLFQGRYKAARIVGPMQLMEESRYIHLNPERAGYGWRQHQHSSVAAYLGERPDPLVDPAPILELFDHPRDYQHFLSMGKVRP